MKIALPRWSLKFCNCVRRRRTDTHTLAAHADRDVAEFRDEIRAQTKLINSTRLDMGDLRGEVTGLRGEVTELRGEMRAGFEALTELLNRLV